ncbi:MAG: hypothetical protein IRZ16_20040 [Myxococcaceae bacterium]|nr:hypothetical protein [Myxococcaceae bacterium]
MASSSDPLRPQFVSGALLRAEDLTLDQDFSRGRFYAANRGLHGVGIATGLALNALSDGRIEVSPGLAIDAEGRPLSLAHARTLDLRAVPAANVWVTLRACDTPSDFEGNTRGTWPRRIREEPTLSAQTAPPDDPLRALVLGRVELSVNREVVRIVSDERLLCGLTVGTLALSDGTGEVARLGAGAEPGALSVTAEKTDLFGDARITGMLGIGSPAPVAGLEVVGTPKVAGTGKLVVGADGALGLGTRFEQELEEGDRLEVPGRGAWVVKEVQGANLLSLSPAPGNVASQVSEPCSFEVAAQLLMRIALGDGSPALAVTNKGDLGVGTFSPRERLHVANGDVVLDSGSAVTFSGDGAVYSADPEDHALQLQAAAKKLTLRDKGDLLFAAGSKGEDSPPTLVVDGKNGFVGIGVRAPPDALTVQGVIEARGGLMFPDGSVQREGVVPIPIGTVIDWWRPDSSLQLSPEGFQICDGSTVTDPDSPLQGTRVPDLRGLFVRGVVSFEEIGTTGGSVDHAHDVPLQSHTHTIDHQHPIQAIFHPTSQTSGTDLGGHSLAVAGHVHSLRDGELTPGPTTHDSQPWAGQSGVQTSKAGDLPPHVVMLKIMRIK